MSFRELFSVFSRRQSAGEIDVDPLTDTFRTRVLLRCAEANRSHYGDFWVDLHKELTYLHGRAPLSSGLPRNAAEDLQAFLAECSDVHFLDFIELVLRSQFYFRVSSHFNLVDDFNEFLLADGLPYLVTEPVWTRGTELAYGEEREVTRLTAHPRVIRKDTQVIHDSAIGPTLELLTDSAFEHANQEFLSALDDFRKGDYNDCLTKCCSSFESVLKVICTRNDWPFSQTDTAAPLLKTVIERAGLETFFEQPLVLVATLRNRLSSSHGAGSVPRVVTPAKAEYAINATAAAILLVARSAP